MGEEGRKTTGAVLGQVLLTDHRTRAVMCSSRTLTPSTHAGHPTWADPSCLRPFCCCFSQGNAIRLPRLHPNPAPLPLPPGRPWLCVRQTRRSSSHITLLPKKPRALCSRALSPPRPEGSPSWERAAPLDATQSQGQVLPKRDAHTCCHGSPALPQESPTDVVHSACSCPMQAFNGSLCP